MVPIKEESTDICIIDTHEMESGVRSLSSFLKDRGMNVKLGLFPLFRDFYTRKEVKEIVDWIKSEDPLLVGISSIEYSRSNTHQLITEIKRRTEKKIVVGGSDPTLNPDEYLPEADFVIRSDGERPLYDLVRSLKEDESFRGIPNLWYKESGEIKKNPVEFSLKNSDEIPFPDWKDLEDHYILKGSKVTQRKRYTERRPAIPNESVFSITTIRGCPYSCSYCSSPFLNEIRPGSEKIRKMSVDKIIDNLKEVKEKSDDVRQVSFCAEDFMVRSREEIERFCNRWKKEINLPFKFTFAPDTFDEEKFSMFVDAGLKKVSVGAQTASNRILKKVYNRKSGVERTKEVAKKLNKYMGRGPSNFEPPEFELIINNPYETESDLRKTLDFLAELPTPFYMSVASLVFFQNTDLHERAIEDGIIDERDPFSRHHYLEVSEAMEERSEDIDEYLNLLIFLIHGRHTKLRHGAVPEFILKYLLKDEVRKFFNKRKGFLKLVARVAHFYHLLRVLRRIANKLFSPFRYIKIVFR